MAREEGLDLVEVAPNARPPVCKILDYGRFVFEREKKAKEARRHQHRVESKEVKFRPNIGDHDFATKVKRAQDFLSRGYHVKLTVMFRMRELRRPENGFELLRRATEDLSDVSVVENPPRPPHLRESYDISGRAAPAFSTTSPTGVCPLSSSFAPITAHSATSGCAASTSSMAPVESRWPATLMMSSVRAMIHR